MSGHHGGSGRRQAGGYEDVANGGRGGSSQGRGRGSNAGSSDNPGGDACGQHGGIMEEAMDTVRKMAERIEDWWKNEVGVAVLVDK